MKALHFGAGNIGRGFIGKLLADAGISLTFADVNSDVVNALNSRHSYPVRLVSEQQTTEIVGEVNAVNCADQAAVATLIASADLLTTAVGPTVLPKIAPLIAKGIVQRRKQQSPQPLNIIACENMVNASKMLFDDLLTHLSAEDQRWLTEQVGFVNCTVDRIVPPPAAGETDPLAVTVETFSEWIVDKNQFKGVPPQIAGMQLTDNLEAFISRKLFTLNTGHAITAYLGKLAGRQTIRDAILDKKIRPVVAGAMQESGAALIKRYGFVPQQHAAYIDKILSRFENPWLQDNVDRVGRQPVRKLGANERLINPLRSTMQYGMENTCLLTGIAAALRFRCDEDQQAKQLADLITRVGVGEALAQLSGLSAASAEVKKVEQIYSSL